MEPNSIYFVRAKEQKIKYQFRGNKQNKQGRKTIAVPGKVLSQGEIDKKIKLVALGFSEKAREKLLESKCEIKNILEEIKKNPNAKGVRILTGR